MIGETREAIEAYCVAIGLVVYEWKDLHEKLARLFALVREGDRQETLIEWYAIRSDTRQREKIRCAMPETTSGRWKKSPRAPYDLKWLLDRAGKLSSDRNNAIHASDAPQVVPRRLPHPIDRLCPRQHTIVKRNRAADSPSGHNAATR
jgi:hypothetical protein